MKDKTHRENARAARNDDFPDTRDDQGRVRAARSSVRVCCVEIVQTVTADQEQEPPLDRPPVIKPDGMKPNESRRVELCRFGPCWWLLRRRLVRCVSGDRHTFLIVFIGIFLALVFEYPVRG